MIYDLNGIGLNDAYSLGGQSLDAAYSLGGQQVFDKQGGGGDDSPKWSSVKWVPVGDSLSDLALTGTADNPSDNKYQSYIGGLLNGINIVNTFSGGRFAQGGTGYWRNSPDYCFWAKASNVTSDATLVTIFGSVNDWTYNGMVNDNYVCPLSKHNERRNSFKYEKVNWVENPHLDVVADNTLAGYVNETISRIHTAAPNAKVIVIPGVNYCLDNSNNNRYMLNAYFLYKAIVEAWHDHVEGSEDWLAFESWYFNPTIAKSTGENGVRYTRTDVFVEDSDQLDWWFQDNYGSTFDSRKIISNNAPTAFAGEYCYDSNNNDFGHWSNKYHQRYLARKFAHVLLKATGFPVTMLPNELRYVDANGNPTDGNFNEYYNWIDND